MKTSLTLGLCSVSAVASAVAADPAGTWKWSTSSPNGEIPTTLKLEWKDGKIAGSYSNQFGATAISNASLQDGVIRFEVVRDVGGKKYVVKYQGKMEGDTLTGTLEAPGHDGGAGVTLDWIAKRTLTEKAGDAKPQ
ncbi:MAG: hypothetical protein JWR15_3177 [Prosthecobacter sp.]|nr:hypothetical protein [Prosthecobacter sp.]